MTYEEALSYIHGISWTFCKPGLERISELCDRLGNPEKDLKFVHVVGTNGKGSFCSMLSSVLTAAGYKTGLYTSPYILKFNERMRVNGENIPDDVLADITERVKPIADSMTDRPTEFELITAIAFLYFKESGVDVVVLEAGMGGRLDSTNVISNPLLTVITGVALDHTAYLGDTVEKIAKEKAGVIKDRAPVLFGGECKGARDVIARIATERGSELTEVDHSAVKVISEELSGTVFSYKAYPRVKLNLLGSYQPRNAATVLEAIDILRTQGLKISDSDVLTGLDRARWAARFEIIDRDPLTIFDGAHNPEGICAAVESIKRYFPGKKVYAISGVLKDKDHAFISRKLSEVVTRAFTVTPDNPRALPAKEYAKELADCGIIALPTEGVKDALIRGREAAKDDRVPLVILGSLYTYVEVIEELSKIKGGN